MNEKERTRLSKFLSLVLRHEPGKIGITLDQAGWVNVGELLEAMRRHGPAMSRESLLHIVETSEKKRFALSDDGLRIRASQGHSVEVELGYAPATPPDLLYHGTVDRFISSIRQTGLVKGARHHVHLSADEATAMKVGDRRGRALLLKIDAAAMAREGLLFYVSANGVWLTDHVPSRFITFPMAQ
jgi:putative RNA 2'-phosphotransferase